MIRFQQTEEQEELAIEVDGMDAHAIVLFNDDVNTFDHVIDCLVTYCDHSPEQAEQCSLIVHYKGKCAVKKGDTDDLQPICDALCREGLSAVIDQL